MGSITVMFLHVLTDNGIKMFDPGLNIPQFCQRHGFGFLYKSLQQRRVEAIIRTAWGGRGQ